MRSAGRGSRTSLARAAAAARRDSAARRVSPPRCSRRMRRSMTCGVFLPSGRDRSAAAGDRARVIRLAFRRSSARSPPEHEIDATAPARRAAIRARRRRRLAPARRTAFASPRASRRPRRSICRTPDRHCRRLADSRSGSAWGAATVALAVRRPSTNRQRSARGVRETVSQTRGGSRKIQDVLVDAKVPRALRDLVPILATRSAVVAVVGHRPGTTSVESGRVVDVQPLDPTWSRERVWGSR